jgi:type IV pilus assembly protein PilQ
LVICLLASACAHETQTRHVQTARVDRETPLRAAAPFPDTAFTSDEERRAPSPAEEPPRSRFETRRIGGDASPTSPRYRGALIDLDVKNADVGNVLRLLADVGHTNIVVSGDVSGTITVTLKRVPWDQALDVIARAKDLEIDHDGDITLVRSRKP